MPGQAVAERSNLRYTRRHFLREVIVRDESDEEALRARRDLIQQRQLYLVEVVAHSLANEVLTN